MQKGRSIFLLAVAFFVIWFVEPIWQWWLDKLLDAATRPHGLSAMMSGTIPAHPFLLGVSVGMVLALFMGYWGRFRSTVVRFEREFSFWFRTFAESLPGAHTLYVGDVRFDVGERETKALMPQLCAFELAIQVEPYSNVAAGLHIPGFILFWRNDVSRAQTVRFEIVGRRLFWGTVRASSSKDVDPLPQSPQGIG